MVYPLIRKNDIVMRRAISPYGRVTDFEILCNRTVIQMSQIFNRNITSCSDMQETVNSSELDGCSRTDTWGCWVTADWFTCCVIVGTR
ncbi:hypothetical protein PR048_014826 [Dryococelus australis]|uniref:Uncharacterized protein n=1 Tax=Dryococelus australis TaxID=614101 RepID=A0ABQ9HF98_9NEOP|nr:hypothetical protein PR048_014826 [Dryococelus australis]